MVLEWQCGLVRSRHNRKPVGIAPRSPPLPARRRGDLFTLINNARPSFVMCNRLGSTGGAPLESDIIEEEGLYSKNDHVIILGKKNFDKKVYGQSHALMVQFYNSFCGHCRKFAPKYKLLANEMQPWKAIIRPAVVDCNVEDNIAICRDFEIMAYPTLRYFHENFQKGSTGERLNNVESAERVKTELIAKMQSEQAEGRLAAAPTLQLSTYSSLTNALQDVPNEVKYTFLIFEKEDSNIGAEVILDTHDYVNIKVKRVSDQSLLAPDRTPALLAVKSALETTSLTPQHPSGPTFLNAINAFLKSKNYDFPVREEKADSQEDILEDQHHPDEDVVYYSDLEATLRTVLHTEITRYKSLTNEAHEALILFLDVVISSFPFKNNRAQEYLMELRDAVLYRKEWSGTELYDLVKQLESKHAPVYITNLKFVGCKGSQTKFRGYSCGLWTLFHTLTVNAARLPGKEGPRVLRAMHGYVKNFFGCTECAEHFQAMAARNRIFQVTENDKAVLWLWISHNEVNLRLAGDETEDPDFPKIQFPSAARCDDCRVARGAWNLPAVLRYLDRVYAAESVLVPRRRHDADAPVAAAASPFSTIDYGMLSLLYILSFIILLLVVKLFLSKRFYRRRVYKHDGLGKV